MSNDRTKLIWHGIYYGVEHYTGGGYSDNSGRQYSSAERRIVDMRKQHYGAPRGQPDRELSAPAPLKGRASPAQIEALIAWAKKADADEPARLAKRAADEDAFSRAAGDAIGAVRTLLDGFGRAEMEEPRGLYVDAAKQHASCRVHLYLANGVVIYLSITYRGMFPAFKKVEAEIVSWKHPRIEGASFTDKIQFLATLPR